MKKPSKTNSKEMPSKESPTMSTPKSDWSINPSMPASATSSKNK